MSISAFIPAFNGSCPAVPCVYLFPAWTTPIHWRLSPLCSPLTISGGQQRGETLERGRDASPERMVRLVHILFALMYAVVVLQLGNGLQVGLCSQCAGKDVKTMGSKCSTIRNKNHVL